MSMTTEPLGGGTLDGLGVELLQWPRDRDVRRSLARAGVARVLLVVPGEDPPADIGVDEDWVRLPADEREVWSRAERLSRLATALEQERPMLRSGRILVHGGGTAVLSRSEAIAVGLLLESPGTIVPRQRFVEALWPDGPPASGRALDALVERLRRRIDGLHLSIRSVRSRGFVIYLGDG